MSNIYYKRVNVGIALIIWLLYATKWDIKIYLYNCVS